jgi:Ni,Fe-hydrogenase III large subunit
MNNTMVIGVDEILPDIAADRDGFVRLQLEETEWSALARGCEEGKQDLLSIWVDGPRARMALIGRDRSKKCIASITLVNGAYPSIGQYHAPAIRLERAMHDLYKVTPEGLPDKRPWLDHGRWPADHDVRRAMGGGETTSYEFLAVEGDGLHQIPVGPVHAGIIEPGHFRFTANGETVVRLEERLGYVHKGIEALCVGTDVAGAARIVSRMSGDSTVAYAFAFARAIEAASDIKVPPRATLLRGIMAELERISQHVNDFGAICNDASVIAIHAHCAILREQVLQTCDVCFGHRLMMDRIVPGGVAVDLTEDGVSEIRRLLEACEKGVRQMTRIYDGMPSILDRTVTTGWVSGELVARFAAGGFVGRASGRNFDSRRHASYPPYDWLDFDVPVREDGDVNARAWIRIDEISQSIVMLRQLLPRLEEGPILHQRKPAGEGEGAALVEAFRGDVFISLRLTENGTVAHCHARDASWFQWPLLEAAIEGNIVADFPLCNKSFNCSYSGHDM